MNEIFVFLGSNPTIVGLLEALAGGLVGAPVVSDVLERSGWFQRLGSSAKSFVVFAITALVPVVAFAVLTYAPANVVAAAEPVFGLVVVCVLAWLRSQAWHRSRTR